MLLVEFIPKVVCEWVYQRGVEVECGGVVLRTAKRQGGMARSSHEAALYR